MQCSYCVHKVGSRLQFVAQVPASSYVAKPKPVIDVVITDELAVDPAVEQITTSMGLMATTSATGVQQVQAILDPECIDAVGRLGKANVKNAVNPPPLKKKEKRWADMIEAEGHEDPFGLKGAVVPEATEQTRKVTGVLTAEGVIVDTESTNEVVPLMPAKVGQGGTLDTQDTLMNQIVSMGKKFAQRLTGTSLPAMAYTVEDISNIYAKEERICRQH